MKVIKRDGRLVDFTYKKIYEAIKKANLETQEKNRLKEELLIKAVEEVEKEIIREYASKNKNVSVEEIQNIVESELIRLSPENSETARRYIRFRFKKELRRQAEEQDKEVLELLAGDSDYWNTENSNKNPKRASVQRDYMAGIESKRISENFLLPSDVLEAHKKGIIHFHDIDYFGQNAIHNCDLINLKDMLNNGTMINDVKIDPQKRLSTACTVATQIITAVASSQYGGVSCTLSHLAPFVRKSFYKHFKNGVKYVTETIYEDEYQKQLLDNISKDMKIDDEHYKKYPETYQYAMDMLKREIKDSVQTFNYQINSMSTTNGQAPFLTVFMYISENPEYEQENAMLIEEFLHQRILGMKNEKGVYVTPAFPKLIYCLDENNIHEDSKYWYLTKLAAECSAKRLVPDYISAKVMKELKGDVYPSMGCRSFLTPDPINHKYYGRLTR